MNLALRAEGGIGAWMATQKLSGKTRHINKDD